LAFFYFVFSIVYEFLGDIIVGMDIGTSKVSMVIGEVNNFNQIEVIYTDSQKCSGNQKGKIIDEDEIVLSSYKVNKKRRN